MLAWGLAQLTGSLVLLWQPVLPHAGIFILSLPLALAALARPATRFIAAFWFGATLAAWTAGGVIEDRLAPALDGDVVEITGRISGLVERDGRRQRFLFEIESGRLGDSSVELPRLARLSLYDDLEIAGGERWRWRAKLRRPRGFANPGTFDYERWLFTQRIGATGYVRDVAMARRIESGEASFRTGVAARVAAGVEGPAAGLLRGLATADRRAISDDQWEVLRHTGTAHLMAISGLHIGLVAGFGLTLAALVRRLCFPRSSHAWPPLVAGVLALVYGALAGFGLPVQRALAGALVLLGALLARRAVLPGHAFGLALTMVLCLDPLAPLGAGFWLSFGAVAAILMLLLGRRPAGSAWRRGLQVQLGLFVLLAPLLLAGFGRLPLVSPPANLVAIPLFAFAIVPLVLAGLLSLAWPAVAGKLFGVAGWLLEHLMEYLRFLAALDPGIMPAMPSPPAWVAGLAGLVLLVAPRAWPGRSLAPILLLPAAWPSLLPGGPAPPLALHFLDVGQGLAVVVETPARTLVYDSGPRFGSSNAAEMVVVPFLESRGRRADRIMISHGDSDHAGGLETLTRRYPGAPVSGRTRDGTVADCAGQRWQWDDVAFEVLHPSADSRAVNNNASCVLLISAGKRRVLLTGDIERAAEARLVKRVPERLDADVALLPHHGSLSSSTRKFVAAVSPRIAIAGAGFANRWNFPRERVVARWERAGAHVLSTGEQGAISIVFENGEMSVHRFREERRLWREPPPRTLGVLP